MQQPSPSEETQALLTRLASRQGVQSTLILSRDTGAIVRSTGLFTSEDEVAADNAPAAPTSGTHMNGSSGQDEENKPKKKGTRNAEEVAAAVWRHMKGAGGMIEALNGEGDEPKLVRVRSRKNELVVVPGKIARERRKVLTRANTDLTVDQKFLLVVIHETPAA